MTNNLDLALNREVVLLGGDQGTGKSYSIVMLVLDALESGHKVMVVDRDRGVSKALREVWGDGAPPENLDYRLAKSWHVIPQAVSDALNTLGTGDWLCFEHLGRLWDFAQTEYSRHVYGLDVSQHLMALNAEARATMAALGVNTRDEDKTKRREANEILAQKTAFSGLDGRTDWSVIKRMHNDDVIDRAILEGSFNILSTTSMTPILKDEVERGAWKMFHGILSRPEGEKHNVFRHDTIAICYKRDGRFLWRTDMGGGAGKDRGRPLFRDIDFTSKGFVSSYLNTITKNVKVG